MASNVYLSIRGNQIVSDNGVASRKLSSSEVGVLRALIDANGEIVSRDQLISSGWPGKVVVSNSLNMAILALRRALHTFGKGKNIVTVPRVGFYLEQAYLFSFAKDEDLASEVGDSGEEATIDVDDDVELYGAKKLNDVSIILNGHEQKRLSTPSIILLSLSIINISSGFFLSLYHDAYKPIFFCKKIVYQNVLCADTLDQDVLNATSNEINNRKDSNVEPYENIEIWLHKNPHKNSGYEYFYFEGDTAE